VDKTLEEIRAELVAEIQMLSVAGDRGSVGALMSRFTDRMVERALRKFDMSIEDKKRQLELGELADKFFQRVKIND